MAKHEFRLRLSFLTVVSAAICSCESGRGQLEPPQEEIDSCKISPCYSCLTTEPAEALHLELFEYYQDSCLQCLHSWMNTWAQQSTFVPMHDSALKIFCRGYVSFYHQVPLESEDQSDYFIAPDSMWFMVNDEAGSHEFLHAFYPGSPFKERRALRLTDDYKYALDCFVGRKEDYKHNDLLSPPELEFAEYESRVQFLQEVFDLSGSHQGNKWYYESQPMIQQMILNPTLDTLILSYRSGYEGGLAKMAFDPETGWILFYKQDLWIE